VSRKNSRAKQSFFLDGETSKALNINDLRRRAPPHGVSASKSVTYGICYASAVPTCRIKRLFEKSSTKKSYGIEKKSLAFSASCGIV
jgi:hypothetical protein